MSQTTLAEAMGRMQERMAAERATPMPEFVREDPDYAPPARTWTCDHCHDLHVVDDDGRIVPCPDCGAAHHAERLRRLCGLAPAMESWTVAQFRAQTPEAKAAKAAARQAVKRRTGWLTLWGPWGTGKTFLLAAVVNECRQAGHLAVYTTVADLLDELRETFDAASGESYSTRFERYRRAKVLALDELEKFRASEWAEEKFFQLIETRYERADTCLTLFATNNRVAPGAKVVPATRYPGYLESRLLDGRFAVHEIGGGDLRPRMTRQD